MNKKTKVRNRHACHPIMSKGGRHEKSNGAKRAAARRQTRRQIEQASGRSGAHLTLPGPIPCQSFTLAAL